MTADFHPPIRHPGESRDPISLRNFDSASRMDRIQWIPAFAGMTEVNVGMAEKNVEMTGNGAGGAA
jgi:hypothetical protein